MDGAEHMVAAAAVRTASDKQLNGIYLQLQMLEESIVYWRFMLSSYEAELARSNVGGRADV